MCFTFVTAAAYTADRLSMSSCVSLLLMLAGGNTAMLEWLKQQKPACPWNSQTCTEAAEWGRLEVLQWLRAQKPPCPWGIETCTAAAEAGNIEMMQWLRGQDPPCPWGPETAAAAVDQVGL